MKYPIYNHFTGAVQFTADIDCAEDAPISTKIGLAVRLALKTGAHLQGANLRGASLQNANLQGASLRGADLQGADLRGTNLQGASLRGADLRGASLQGVKIKYLFARITRTIEPYEFLAFQTDANKCVIVAGCRGPWTVEEYRAHIKKNYPNTPKAEETLAILGFIETRASESGGKMIDNPGRKIKART